MEHMGLISLIPTATVIFLAVLSRRALEPLIGGVIIGFLILNGTGVMGATIDSALTVLGDDTIRWIMLAVGLFGALTSLLVHSGGASAFSKYLIQFIKNRTSALITTWGLGLVIFIDDYLNALTVGSSMKGLTDKFKISRQMLAYVVDTTAAPICVLIPLSTWAIYVSGLLESNGVAAEGQGISVYIQAIPYMIYPIVAAILVPLVAIKLIPALGPMKKAEQKAATGELTATLVGKMETQPDSGIDQKIINFLIPIASLLFFTWFFDIDILKGVIAALIVTFILFGLQRLMPFGKMFDYAMDGLKGMVPAMLGTNRSVRIYNT